MRRSHRTGEEDRRDVVVKRTHSTHRAVSQIHPMRCPPWPSHGPQGVTTRGAIREVLRCRNLSVRPHYSFVPGTPGRPPRAPGRVAVPVGFFLSSWE